MQQKPTDVFLLNANNSLLEGNVAAAIVLLKDAIKQYPDFYQGWLLLSKCLFESGYIKESVQVSHNAERVDPLQEDFRYIQGQMQRNALNEAEKTAKQMLEKQLGHPRAIFTLAHIASVKGNYDESIRILLEGIAHSPANTTLQHMLMETWARAGDYTKAIEAANVLIGIEESFDSVWALITLLLKYGQHDDLLKACNRAETLCNQDKLKLSHIEMVRGQALRIKGEREQSVRAFKNSLAANPHNVDAWWALADMKNYHFNAQDKSAIQDLLKTPNLPQALKCVATFALAKVSEADGDHDVTMSLYGQANRLHDSRQYSPAHTVNEFAARIDAYSSEVLSIQAEPQHSQPTPIFIVGLPRSGSTLIEQILASHSQIEGTFEQPTLPSVELKSEAMCRRTFSSGLSSSLSVLSPADLCELGQSYLDKGQLFRQGGKAFFTDKQPFNFRLIGLIHKILPNAKIIDARRNPLDCGLSLYKQYFPSGVDFSYNLEHIGAFYNAYVQLMKYWDSALPGKILRVQHENLVNSPEKEIRRLLDYVGVEFESSCINFHKTGRSIHTASSEQVRQPITNKGIGSWRTVENSLSPLIQCLDADILNEF